MAITRYHHYWKKVEKIDIVQLPWLIKLKENICNCLLRVLPLIYNICVHNYLKLHTVFRTYRTRTVRNRPTINPSRRRSLISYPKIGRITRPQLPARLLACLPACKFSHATLKWQYNKQLNEINGQFVPGPDICDCANLFLLICRGMTKLLCAQLGSAGAFFCTIWGPISGQGEQVQLTHMYV
jgi:hypothetical protein